MKLKCISIRDQVAVLEGKAAPTLAIGTVHKVNPETDFMTRETKRPHGASVSTWFVNIGEGYYLLDKFIAVDNNYPD